MEYLCGIYPIKITIISGIIGFIIIQISFKINKKKIETKDLICNIKIKIAEKIIITKAFIDSGNILKDPISGKPVIIMEAEEIKKVIDIKQIIGGDLKKYFRIIPFKLIGEQNGMLYRNKS